MSGFGVTASNIKARSRLSSVMFCRDVCLQRRKQSVTMAEEFICFHAAMQKNPKTLDIQCCAKLLSCCRENKMLQSASSPINNYPNAKRNEQHGKTRNQSKFGVFFQNRLSSIRYTDTQFLFFFFFFG